MRIFEIQNQSEMKKILLIVATGCFLFNAKAAVTLLNADTEAPITNGTSYQVWGDVSEALITWHGIDVINLTGGTTKINMKRYTLNAQTGVEDYFCWYVCLGSVNSVNNPELNHSAGSCFNSNNGDTITLFSNYYKPFGALGSSTYRYVWFNASNPNDSAWADVTFNVTPVSVTELNKDIKLSLFPNPANEVINLNVENVDFNQGVSVQIVNVLGEVVYTRQIQSSTIRIDAIELANGAYFCTLIADRKTILTKRIIISH